jgi:hypothetical protein
MTMELRFVPVGVEGQAWCSAWRLTGPDDLADAFVSGCPQDLQRPRARLAQGPGGGRTAAGDKEGAV